MKNEPPRIETQRLILRPLSLDDAADLHPAFADPETMRFWHTPPHRDVEATRAELRTMLGSDRANYWAITLKGDERAVGYLGYLGNEGAPGFGYLLRRDLWRHGYGAEAVRAALTHGFDVLGYDRTELWIHENNVASQRLAIKVGFTQRGEFRIRWGHFASPHVMRVFGLFASDWPGAPQQPQPERIAFDRVEPILTVPNVQAAAEFYRDKLGFGIEFLWGNPPTHAGVARGEWTYPAVRIQLSQGEPPRPAGTLFIFVGPTIESLYDDYRAKGVAIASPLERKPWGMREFTARDLNGYHLRFGTPS
jgi:RimJ/RimL family protein N-acetyltransferase/uncharacterized glyoxalase superfamily protein PhnB